MIKDISKIIVFTLGGTSIIGGIISLSMWIYDCETNYTEYTAEEDEQDSEYFVVTCNKFSIHFKNYADMVDSGWFDIVKGGDNNG